MRTPIIAVLALLTGCATEPIPTSQAVAVPPERISNADLTIPRAGTGSVIVKRDPTLRGFCPFRLYENGKLFAEIRPGEKVQIYLAPGEHIIGAKLGGHCDGNIEAPVSLTTGQTRTYRTTMDGNNQLLLHPTAF